MSALRHTRDAATVREVLEHCECPLWAVGDTDLARAALDRLVARAEVADAEAVIEAARALRKAESAHNAEALYEALARFDAAQENGQTAGDRASSPAEKGHEPGSGAPGVPATPPPAVCPCDGGDACVC